ncbi:MAG: site-specific integrase [Chloroflexota bacterium]
MKLSSALRGYWLERKRDLAERTILAYQGVYDDFINYVSDIDVSEITPQMLREFLNAQYDRGVGD